VVRGDARIWRRHEGEGERKTRERGSREAYYKRKKIWKKKESTIRKIRFGHGIDLKWSSVEGSSRGVTEEKHQGKSLERGVRKWSRKNRKPSKRRRETYTSKQTPGRGWRRKRTIKSQGKSETASSTKVPYEKGNWVQSCKRVSHEKKLRPVAICR